MPPSGCVGKLPSLPAHPRQPAAHPPLQEVQDIADPPHVQLEEAGAAPGGGAAGAGAAAAAEEQQEEEEEEMLMLVEDEGYGDEHPGEPCTWQFAPGRIRALRLTVCTRQHAPGRVLDSWPGAWQRLPASQWARRALEVWAALLVLAPGSGGQLAP